MAYWDWTLRHDWRTCYRQERESCHHCPSRDIHLLAPQVQGQIVTVGLSKTSPGLELVLLDLTRQLEVLQVQTITSRRKSEGRNLRPQAEKMILDS